MRTLGAPEPDAVIRHWAFVFQISRGGPSSSLMARASRTPDDSRVQVAVYSWFFSRKFDPNVLVCQVRRLLLRCKTHPSYTRDGDRCGADHLLIHRNEAAVWTCRSDDSTMTRELVPRGRLVPATSPIWTSYRRTNGIGIRTSCAGDSICPVCGIRRHVSGLASPVTACSVGL